jgi:hypothetical protein
MEECRELARHAVEEEDRAFWQQAAARWEEQLRAMQQIRPPKKPHSPTFGVSQAKPARAARDAARPLAGLKRTFEKSP